MKYIITLHGDPSVGFNSMQLEATLPPPTDYDEEDMIVWTHQVKEKLIELYGENEQVTVMTEEEIKIMQEHEAFLISNYKEED
jgi:hypothetical protein